MPARSAGESELTNNDPRTTHHRQPATSNKSLVENELRAGDL
jgi:hypothetical protein